MANPAKAVKKRVRKEIWDEAFEKALEERKIELGEPVEQDNSEPSLNASDAEE